MTEGNFSSLDFSVRRLASMAEHLGESGADIDKHSLIVYGCPVRHHVGQLLELINGFTQGQFGFFSRGYIDHEAYYLVHPFFVGPQQHLVAHPLFPAVFAEEPVVVDTVSRLEKVVHGLPNLMPVVRVNVFAPEVLSLIHISEPTRLGMTSYA